MTQTENKGPDFVLLGKYLAGEASAMEAIAIENWLADTDHRKQFDELFQWWNGLPPAFDYKKPEEKEIFFEWQLAMQSKELKRNGSSSRRVKIALIGFIIAAILTLIIIWLQ